MNATVQSLLNTSGYPLIAVVCCLIVLEELGIPMPVFPGDLMLVLAGVAVVTSHLNPFVVPAATYAAAVAGALGGREIGEQLGRKGVARIARLLHAGDHVDRLSAKLRRGGSLAVFLGRLTPGVRIVTNQASGLVGMPRRTFAMGLAPAVAVYQAVFMGLGAWLGKPAWDTIRRYEPTPGQVLLALSLLAVCALATHIIVGLARRRGLAGGSLLRILLLG